jgi:hypothetical protein
MPCRARADAGHERIKTHARGDHVFHDTSAAMWDALSDGALSAGMPGLTRVQEEPSADDELV